MIIPQYNPTPGYSNNEYDVHLVESFKLEDLSQFMPLVVKLLLKIASVAAE